MGSITTTDERAPTGPRTVATGESPWLTNAPIPIRPEGAAEGSREGRCLAAGARECDADRMGSAAPSGRVRSYDVGHHGLAPVATIPRPVGAEQHDRATCHGTARGRATVDGPVQQRRPHFLGSGFTSASSVEPQPRSPNKRREDNRGLCSVSVVQYPAGLVKARHDKAETPRTATARTEVQQR
jgi:hypothetical protein